MADSSPRPAGLTSAERMAEFVPPAFGQIDAGHGSGWSGLVVWDLTMAEPHEAVLPPSDHHMVNLTLGQELARRAWGGKSVEGLFHDGDLAVIPAERDVYWLCQAPANAVHVFLPPSLLTRTAGEVGLRPDRIELVDQFAARDAALERALRAIQAELRHPGLGGPVYTQTLAMQLAVLLLRGYVAFSPPPADNPRGLAPWRLRRVVEHARAHLADGLTLEAMAKAAGLSPYHFCRLFHRSTGLTPHQWVLRERVAWAQKLLAEGHLPLSQVGLLTGFGDQSHFTATFRKLVGTTPGRYRQARRG